MYINYDILYPKTNTYIIIEGDSLDKITSYFELNSNDIININSNINPQRLVPGQLIQIPLKTYPIGISINTKTKTLALYKYSRVIKSYSIAVGKPSTPSPKGTFKIVNKQINPGGPFGTRWMGLNILSYGIHGTSNPSSIGTNTSNGCIRLHNNDINELFNLVPIETTVKIS